MLDDIGSIKRKDPFASIERSVGAALGLMSHDPNYAKLPIRFLYGKVLPAVATRQFSIIRNSKSEPVAFASWALATQETEDKITDAPFMLKPSEWKNGDRGLLVDLAVRDPQMHHRIVMRIKERVFRDKVFKALKKRGDDKPRWVEIKLQKR